MSRVDEEKNHSATTTSGTRVKHWRMEQGLLPTTGYVKLILKFYHSVLLTSLKERCHLSKIASNTNIPPVTMSKLVAQYRMFFTEIKRHVTMETLSHVHSERQH